MVFGVSSESGDFFCVTSYSIYRFVNKEQIRKCFVKDLSKLILVLITDRRVFDRLDGTQEGSRVAGAHRVALKFGHGKRIQSETCRVYLSVNQTIFVDFINTLETLLQNNRLVSWIEDDDLALEIMLTREPKETISCPEKRCYSSKDLNPGE